MGNAASGILAYGFDLGSDESEWLVEEVDEYGGLDVARFAWFNQDDDDDFVTQAGDHLLAASGFTETDWESEGYFERERVAKDAVGVVFESHCSGDYPIYVLAAHVITVYQGHVKELNLAELAKDAAAGDWDRKLRGALQVLGLTPKQEKPAWLLCSYWG